ncbi:hypothetical protein KSD_01200 [Ktedonobacter sp. SOSP1-85]|nr:hypothetical protein KSD_01200 [Ktedonobacter sp. SOSP1-85]
MTRGFEAAHAAFSLSCRLMGILSSIVEAFVLPVLDTGHDLPLGCRVTGQFVGDDHTGTY